MYYDDLRSRWSDGLCIFGSNWNSLGGRKLAVFVAKAVKVPENSEVEISLSLNLGFHWKSILVVLRAPFYFVCTEKKI